MSHRKLYITKTPIAGHMSNHHPAAWRNLNGKRVQGVIARWDFSTGFWLLQFVSPNWEGIEKVVAPIREMYDAIAYNEERACL